MTGVATPSLSVVVPARDAEATLAEQLTALMGQTGCVIDEVVVADNRSSDGTRRLAATWMGEGPPVRVVDASAVPGSAHARNAAVATIGSDIVAFCDADDVVASGWAAALVEALATTDADLVGGRLDGELLNTRAVSGWRSPRAEGLTVPEGFLPFAPSGNMAVRRAVWNELGGMRTDYPKSHDVEFSWRAQLAGHRLGYAPMAIVHYRYRDTPAGVFDQALRSGRAMAQLYSDFGPAGLSGRTARQTLRDWAWLPVRLPLLGSAEGRGVWLRRAGQAMGRVRGSIAFRVRYL